MSVVNGQAKILSYLKKDITVWLTVENASDDKDYVEIPLLYYDWYRAEDAEAHNFTLSPGENNVLRIEVPAQYSGSIRIYFAEPVLWRVAELLSLLTLFLMVAAEMMRRKVWRKFKTENYSFPT